MKKWKMRFTLEAARLLSKLHPENKKPIKQVLTKLRQNPHTGKDLQEELSGFKSLRLKQYRVIYNINEEKKIIQIYHIGRRQDVYEQFRRLLIELQKSP
ncbi:MAG: type II toxin-antitoxin system mRNA interferase toxin, RelE/StbE family [Desulfobacterales bacterium]|jgi:addiction module RelE/StbE family toxin